MARLSAHVPGKLHLLAYPAVLVFCVVAPATADTNFQFLRMWPTPQQPWYFLGPEGLALDDAGNVYIADTGNHRIQKFTRDGIYVTQWGSHGTGNGRFHYPRGLAIDSLGDVYVADSGNSCIKKFTRDGTYLMQWGIFGGGDGQFIWPHDVALDNAGNVYVADTGNDRVQKFSSSGVFITRWGSHGTGTGQFDSPRGVGLDGAGYLYVADTGNSRVQKFTSNGEYTRQWGSYGESDGQFHWPNDVATDDSGNVYVVDSSYRVHKFTNDGQFLLKWGSYGHADGDMAGTYRIAVDITGDVFVADHVNGVLRFTNTGIFNERWCTGGVGDGQFIWPEDVAVNGVSNVYIVDTSNHRIQMFNGDGMYMTQWGSLGQGDAQFYYPTGVAVDGAGNVYVTDQWDRVRKFTNAGIYLSQWGSYGSADGEFWSPNDVAVDSIGNVFVVDRFNFRIQKFTNTGNFLTKWGTQGTGNSQFLDPHGIAVDNSGNVYVSDWESHRIQKFTNAGAYITQWGGYGDGIGEFRQPSGIAVDGAGNIFVADYWNYRVQKFTNNGVFLSTFGESGSSTGGFSLPSGIAVGPTGRIYVTDTANDHVQVFRELAVAPASKTIIVAAGGPFAGNNLWDATQLCANFAYRTLTYQGFTKDRIQYLSSDLDLDLDGNGEPDDVDADATNANLQSALTAWATSGGTDDVLLYLVDHGGVGTFRMNGTETLDVAALAGWMDTLDAGITGTLTVVYDACKSGSFLAALSAPGRIVITSTSPTEDAFFVTQGVISFSNYFWTEIFAGSSIGEAFTTASNAMSQTFAFQTPLLDDNGNGTGNELGDGTLAAATYLGNGTAQSWEGPVIGGVVPDPMLEGTSEALLWADPVTDADGVARVWAVLRPPDWEKPGDNNPVTGLPGIDLLPVVGDGFEATYSSFTTPGTYDVLIYARDRVGNTSAPVETTVTVTNPRSRKVLLVAGGTTGDARWPAIEYLAGLAYQSLKFQGYDDTNLYYLSQTTTPGVDGLGTLANIQFACTTWAVDETQDFTVYLVGPGLDGAFQVSGTQNLAASQLDTWLDASQASIPGKVTVVCDADYSATFLQPLRPPSGLKRITVVGAGPEQGAQFLAGGQISFSKYFWGQVADGATVLSAFRYANLAMNFAGNGQRGELDDSGDGIYHTKQDGALARRYLIGAGITLAGDTPLIGWAVPQQTISTSSAQIWAIKVTTTGAISRVYAVILPPLYSGEAKSASEAVTVTLSHIIGTNYAATYNGFTLSGAYQVALYAEDTEGNVSAPVETWVYRTGAGDADGDGLLDSWETAHGLSTSDATGDNGANGDLDGDGFTNGEEYLADSDPNDPDSYPPLSIAWVDFAHTGDTLGTVEDPFATLGLAATQLANGGMVKLRGDSTLIASGETLTISKAMRLQAINGAVTLGSAAP